MAVSSGILCCLSFINWLRPYDVIASSVSRLLSRLLIREVTNVHAQRKLSLLHLFLQTSSVVRQGVELCPGPQSGVKWSGSDYAFERWSLQFSVGYEPRAESKLRWRFLSG